MDIRSTTPLPQHVATELHRRRIRLDAISIAASITPRGSTVQSLVANAAAIMDFVESGA